MGQELTIKNVNKSFEVNGEKINVLNDINLDIKEGEFVVLVGHSGCGKSTLLKIIAGLEKNDTGLVAAGGQEITEPAADRGMIFQEHRMFPTTASKHGARSLKTSAASSAFSTAASTGEERTAPAMTISLSPTICTGSRMNLIFRNFRRECSGLCASTQTTQTITESVRQKAWRQGRSRRKSFASIWFRRGVFWYFAALSQFPVRHPKRMAKKLGKW